MPKSKSLTLITCPTPTTCQSAGETSTGTCMTQEATRDSAAQWEPREVIPLSGSQKAGFQLSQVNT